MSRAKQCFECMAGEHENLDDDVNLVSIVDPDGNERTVRRNLCNSHVNTRLEDGYTITRKDGRPA